MSAAIDGYTTIVNALINAGAKVDLQNEVGTLASTRWMPSRRFTGLPCCEQSGGTALMAAAIFERTDAVQALIAAGANSNLQEKVCRFVSGQR
jgi:ankyrin repeat protein